MWIHGDGFSLLKPQNRTLKVTNRTAARQNDAETAQNCPKNTRRARVAGRLGKNQRDTHTQSGESKFVAAK